MSDEIKLVALICARNAITLICFTILAIVFGHWWIVFFAIVFWAYQEKQEDK